jgi:hypothetical protein
MEPERQEAYRRLLYTVLLQLRSGDEDRFWHDVAPLSTGPPPNRFPSQLRSARAK